MRERSQGADCRQQSKMIWMQERAALCTSLHLPQRVSAISQAKRWSAADHRLSRRRREREFCGDRTITETRGELGQHSIAAIRSHSDAFERHCTTVHRIDWQTESVISNNLFKLIQWIIFTVSTRTHSDPNESQTDSELLRCNWAFTGITRKKKKK